MHASLSLLHLHSCACYLQTTTVMMIGTPLTIQLNNDWMSLGLQSSKTPPTLHIKKKATRSFMVVLCHTAGKEHEDFLINNVPSWPVWQVSEAMAVLDLLHPKFKKWVDMDLDHVHQLMPDCVMMFRHRSLNCINFEDTKDSFYPPNVNIHIRNNLPGECTTLRRLYSIKHRLPEAPRTPGSAAEDSNVEIVGEKQTRVKQENFEDLLAPRRQCPCLRIDTNKCIVINDDIDTPVLTPCPPPSHLFLVWSLVIYVSFTVLSHHIPLISPSISYPTSSENGLAHLQHNCLTVAVLGVAYLASSGWSVKDFKGLARHNHFECAFKRPYITSTMSKQKAIYAAATEEEVQKGVDAGHSKDGLWIVWRKKHGLAACIAARRGHAV
ncbi:hypothetical protein DFH08DRAFT_964310 [Mycena albidolilacea]|uniref:Uncharacterized protein n=1 Tax=Mycena albidolilacea TaxID=1033008 RepID=A0AAD6ZTW1_9AGAR|nr:hypothetical protein DFH08DRAFT_964310 [Mycena albidolilacea]